MESEWIDGLLEYPEWFGILCRYSLPMDEPEARWQFADRLPRAEVPDGCRKCITMRTCYVRGRNIHVSWSSTRSWLYSQRLRQWNHRGGRSTHS